MFMLSIGILFDLLIDFTDDNLGSIDTITDGQGNIVERMSYAAFGERRKGDWRASDPLLPIICSLHNCIYYNSEYCKGIGYRDQH
jgi:hypothetical protein